MRAEGASRSLAGRVALVTGAAGGIGRAVSAALAAAGARIALTGRTAQPLDAVAQEIVGHAADVLVIPADVTREADVTGLIRAIETRWSDLDIVVNCAGINVRERSLEHVSVADWERITAVNVLGPLLVCRSAIELMRRLAGGRIVLISSTAGLGATLLSGPAYSSSKAALNSLAASINLSEREHGIGATLICPGDVSTPLLDRWPKPPSAHARARMLQPEDVAALTLATVALPARALVELAVIRPLHQAGALR